MITKNHAAKRRGRAGDGAAPGRRVLNHQALSIKEKKKETQYTQALRVLAPAAVRLYEGGAYDDNCHAVHISTLHATPRAS